jgi:hypothetical protein
MELTMSSNNMKPSTSGVPEAQLIIDLSKTDLAASAQVYIYVVGLVAGTSDIFYYLDKDFMPQIMSTSNNSQAAGTFPSMSALPSDAQHAIAANYPLAWADWSIPVSIGSNLILNLGAINTSNIPSLGTGTAAFSGRIYMSVGLPRLPFTVQASGYTAPVFGGISGISGSLTQYDWIEFSYDSLGNFNGNTTQVNQFGLPLMLTGTPAGGKAYPTQGTLEMASNKILNAIANACLPLGSASVMTPIPDNCAAAYPAGTRYLRAVSPTTASSDASSELNRYFDYDIATAYKAWAITPLVTHDLSSGAYTGVVFPLADYPNAKLPAGYKAGALAFYQGDFSSMSSFVKAHASSPDAAFLLTSAKSHTISSNDIWQCAGSLASGDSAQKNVGKMIAAAFNRGVMVSATGAVTTHLNDATCAAQSSGFYPANTRFNSWAQAFHAYNINGLAYGFPYDDVCDQNPSIPPSSGTLVASFIRITLGNFGSATPE